MRFVKCLVKIRIFLIEQGKAYPELEDEKWLVKLMFLADNTSHLNELNLRLQDTGQKVMCLFELGRGFVSTLHVHTRDTKLKLFATLNTRRLSQWMTELMHLKLIST